MSHSEQLKFRIRPAGEGALCLTLKGPLDEEKNIRIMALKARLEREGETMGFGETIPGFVSLEVADKKLLCISAVFPGKIVVREFIEKLR